MTADRETLAAGVYGALCDDAADGLDLSDLAEHIADALLAGPLASLPEFVCPACGATTRAGETP